MGMIGGFVEMCYVEHGEKSEKQGRRDTVT